MDKWTLLCDTCLTPAPVRFVLGAKPRVMLVEHAPKDGADGALCASQSVAFPFGGPVELDLMLDAITTELTALSVTLGHCVE